MSTAFTQAQLDLLEVAISQGVRTVKYTDKEVTYHSLAEMLQLRQTMRVALGLVSTAGNRAYFETSKGLK